MGGNEELKVLQTDGWRPFLITSLFKLIRGRENNMASLGKGSIPLISARRINNGLKGFVNTSKTVSGHCITLNNDGDGGAGLAYYQPSEMALDSHVTALEPISSQISQWTMLFISKCLSGLHGFFGHGLSISNKRAEKIKIMLPVDDTGNPDYAYMEQYGRHMMLRKYQQYLDFIDSKNNCI